MKLGITGSRELSDEPEYYEHPEVDNELMECLSTTWPDEILLGGARGIDDLVLRFAYDFRENSPMLKAKLVVIVPFALEDQPNEVIPNIKKYADEVIELDLPRNNSAYHIRNDRILDEADRILGFWNGSSRGTKSTLLKAEERGIPVDVAPVGEALLEESRRVTESVMNRT